MADKNTELEQALQGAKDQAALNNKAPANNGGLYLLALLLESLKTEPAVVTVDDSINQWGEAIKGDLEAINTNINSVNTKLEAISNYLFTLVNQGADTVERDNMNTEDLLEVLQTIAANTTPETE